jgi:hypothetical protein
MSYIPYTASKDYFEEPGTGGDLVLLFDMSSGELQVTCIQETDILQLGLIPPSSKIGVTYGKTLDLIKVFASATPFFTSDTTLLFNDLNSTFLSQLQGGAFSNLKSLATLAGVTLTQDIYAGKILRVDYFPESSGRSASAVITLLLYI